MSNPSNNITRQRLKSSAELRANFGVVTVKRPRRCGGCGRLMVMVNPRGGCLACQVEKVEVTTPPKLAKRREFPQVYCPAVYSFGSLTGRVA